MLITGIIIGILISTLIFVILAFFRAGIEKRVRVIETVLGQAGPKAKGYVFEPEDDTDLLRQEIINKNSREGRDTPLEELR